MAKLTTPPEGLSPEARKVWRRIAGELDRTGIIDWADRDALAMYCENRVEIEKVTAIIEAEGGWFRPNKRGMSRLHPLAKRYDQLVRRSLSLADRLGMTPLGRAKLRNEKMKMPRLRAAKQDD